MFFEEVSVDAIIQHERHIKPPKEKEQYFPTDLFSSLTTRAQSIHNKQPTPTTTRRRTHYKYSTIQSEVFLTVKARKYLADRFNVELFDVLFVYLTRSKIGKTLLNYCISVISDEEETDDTDVAAEVVKAWRVARLPLNGYNRFKTALNCPALSKKLPSSDKVEQYHAAIVPFIKYSLKISPFKSENITAVSPNIAIKLLQFNNENSCSLKLWWDDRRVENSKGIITLSKNGSSLKKDILVILLSSIKLKELFQSNDQHDKEVLHQVIPEIQQIMNNNPLNYCSSDLLAMKEILDPSFKHKNQSSNILSSLEIINYILNDDKLTTKSKTKYLINIIPHKMRGKLLALIDDLSDISINNEVIESHILSIDEENLCSNNNISTKYAYLLGSERTFFDQLPICWRCNCTKKLNKVSLLEQIPLTPFYPNLNIEFYNIFKLRFFQHIFDLLHCDARTLEHMLNNTCMNDDRLLDFLVEILPILVKKHCGQTIHLKLSVTKDNKNNGDSTKIKKSFSFIDASYVKYIIQVYPYFLEEMKIKFDEILFEEQASTVDTTEVRLLVENTFQTLHHSQTIEQENDTDSLIGNFLDNLILNDDIQVREPQIHSDDMDVDFTLQEVSEDQEENNEDAEDPLFDIDGKNVNDREIIQIIHDIVGVGNNFNPFSKDGKISILWSLFHEVQEYLHYSDEIIIEVLKNPQLRNIIQARVEKYCSFYVEVFEKSPHYLHQMKYHLIEAWMQISSLKNGMNYINEGLGKYHVTDNMLRGRNGGLGTDSRWDLITQHITDGFLFNNSKLWSELQKVMKDRYQFRSSKAEFDKKLDESDNLLLTHLP